MISGQFENKAAKRVNKEIKRGKVGKDNIRSS